MSLHPNKTKKIRWKSISRRVTIWYSIFFVLLSALLMVGIYLVSDYYITQSAHNQLEAAVIDSVGDYAEGDFEANDNGVYLSRYTVSGQLIEGSVPIPLSSLFNHQTLAEASINGIRYLYYDYYDQDTKFWFRGILSAHQNDLIINNLLLIMMVSLPISLVLILGGGYWIIRRALAPIKTMSDTAQQIERDLDLSKRIFLAEGNSELHQLAKTFNSMLEKVQDSYDRERQFTGDVSHELRTPIAVIKSESEYIQGLEPLPKEAQEGLAVIERQTRQMTKLVTTLLEMARIDNQQSIDSQSLDLSPILAEQIDNYDIIAETQHKQLIKAIDHPLPMQGDSQLLKRLIDNLLANAVKFSQKRIWVTATKEKGTICLTISNDGPVIPADQLDKIWHRMYQLDNSRHTSSLGLGLSFVKKIAELHQATIKVTSQDDRTHFEVCFPSSS